MACASKPCTNFAAPATTCEIISNEDEDPNHRLPNVTSVPDAEEKKTPDIGPLGPGSLANPSDKLAEFFADSQPIPYKVKFSYVSEKLEARTSPTGCGMFAIQDVKQHETLLVWTGRVVDATTALAVMDTSDKHYILQVGDGFYQIPLSSDREPADWTNHSCEPNAGFGKNSPICLSAMRDIAAGEQICFDYGLCETDPRLWEPMECMCGTKSCRGMITANDWKLPALHERYRGYWSPHVQRLIDGLESASVPKSAAVVARPSGTKASASAAAPTAASVAARNRVTSAAVPPKPVGKEHPARVVMKMQTSPKMMAPIKAPSYNKPQRAKPHRAISVHSTRSPIAAN